MSRTPWKQWLLCGLVATAPSLAATLKAEDPAPQPKRAIYAIAPQADVVLRLTEGDGEEPLVGEYWLGIMLGELPDVVRQQLNLDHGLVVGDVNAESPAAKAGVKKHDILI